MGRYSTREVRSQFNIKSNVGVFSILQNIAHFGAALYLELTVVSSKYVEDKGYFCLIVNDITRKQGMLVFSFNDI